MRKKLPKDQDLLGQDVDLLGQEIDMEGSEIDLWRETVDLERLGRRLKDPQQRNTISVARKMIG